MPCTHVDAGKISTGLGIGLVVLLFGLPLFRGLALEDLGNDEAIYSYAVDSIVEGGSWLSPASSPSVRRPGDPRDRAARVFLEKPPLKVWIVAAPIELGLLPGDEFGLRFWDAFFGLLAFIYVFMIGRRLVDPVFGFAAVFVLFLQWWLLFHHGLRANVMEAALLLGYCGGIYHFLAWTDEERGSVRWLHIMAFAGWFSLGFMTKFVAALFLPMIVGVTALCFADWRHRLRADGWRWIAGALVATALIVPWFAYQTAQQGWSFWEYIFGRQVYERMRFSVDPDHVQAWFFYFRELYIEQRNAGTHEWVILGAALWCIESVRRRWSGGFLVLIWFVLPFTLISISPSKLYHYAFPFLPPVAFFAAFPVSLLARLARGRPTEVDWLHAGLARLPTDRIAGGYERFVRRGGVRVLFATLAIAALVISAATLILGPIRLAPFGVQLLSNSSVVRPIFIAALCTLPFLPLRWVMPAAVLAVLVYAWPFDRYGMIHERLLEGARPMRAVSDCIVERYGELNASGLNEPSRIYVHLPTDVGLTHNYFYYFKRLERWERRESLDDEHLRARLFEAEHQAPTLILEEDYRAFLATAGGRERGAAGELPDSVVLGNRGSFTRTLVLLPGPFAACVEAGLREGGTPFDADDAGDDGQ